MSEDRGGGAELRQRLSWSLGIAVGMVGGVALGSALENMALGVGIGVALGVVCAVLLGMHRPRGRRDAEDGEHGDLPAAASSEPEDPERG